MSQGAMKWNSKMVRFVNRKEKYLGVQEEDNCVKSIIQSTKLPCALMAFIQSHLIKL